MYYIVNYIKFYRYPKEFKTFNDAFMRYELINDPENIIEYFDENYNREIVWKKEFEEQNMDILLGKNDEKFKGILWIN